MLQKPLHTPGSFRLDILNHKCQRLGTNTYVVRLDSNAKETKNLDLDMLQEPLHTWQFQTWYPQPQNNVNDFLAWHNYLCGQIGL